MKRKKVYIHSENRTEQLVKTAYNKRDTYIYRFYGKETVGGKSREYIEEIEISPDEDDITPEEIKKFYVAEDHEVYENLKAFRPQRTAEEKQLIAEWKAEYVRRFKTEYGYEPHPADGGRHRHISLGHLYSASLWRTATTISRRIRRRAW